MPARKSQKNQKARSPLVAVPEGSNTNASSSSKKRKRAAKSGSGKLLRKFVAGLAARLAGDGDGQDNASVIVGALLAAVSALPEGRLRKELEEGQAEAMQLLTAELAVLNRHKSPSGRDSPATTVVVMPCTQALYSHARRTAEKAVKTTPGDGGGQLRALALNPRAPLDLLLDAMSDGLFRPASFTGATLQVSSANLHCKQDQRVLWCVGDGV